MSTAVKVSAFAAALVAVFAVAWAIGSAVGPLDEDPPPPAPTSEHHGHHPGGTP
ncbi:hypothetical protein AB0E55_17065 [Amycolatopsis keratiniphila]|uniref:hypothetical protein n=1 Tax=Amycolatopsis TaxID=1813 RepID=UPI00087B18D3|nr:MULTISPECIES: hypothetical protein [Amycolatopsis]SDU41848.1 hypothetical protein SAMN04489733_4007 [Amycolatopsis keratiniphila]